MATRCDPRVDRIPQRLNKIGLAVTVRPDEHGAPGSSSSSTASQDRKSRQPQVADVHRLAGHPDSLTPLDRVATELVAQCRRRPSSSANRPAGKRTGRTAPRRSPGPARAGDRFLDGPAAFAGILCVAGDSREIRGLPSAPWRADAAARTAPRCRWSTPGNTPAESLTRSSAARAVRSPRRRPCIRPYSMPLCTIFA